MEKKMAFSKSNFSISCQFISTSRIWHWSCESWMNQKWPVTFDENAYLNLIWSYPDPYFGSHPFSFNPRRLFHTVISPNPYPRRGHKIDQFFSKFRFWGHRFLWPKLVTPFPDGYPRRFISSHPDKMRIFATNKWLSQAASWSGVVKK